MPPVRRRTVQIILAAAVLAIAVTLTWFADSAMREQFKVLRGSWPATVELNGQPQITDIFWRRYVSALKLNPVAEFFYLRMDHNIHFYLAVLAAIVGWSASTFLRVIRAEQAGHDRATSSWGSYFSSLLLAGIAGAIVFLLAFGGRLGVDFTGDTFLSMGFRYSTIVAALLAGLFLTAFFDWLEKFAREKIWPGGGS